MVVSILALVMGFLTAVFGFMKSGGAQELMEKGAEATDQDTKGMSFEKDLGIPTDAAVGTLIIVGGVLTIITGVFGGLTVKFKKVFFAVPFVALSFIVALLLLIGAMIALAPSGELVKEGCEFIAKEENAGLNPAVMYKELVDTNMCSEACKCDEAHKDKWTADTVTTEQLTQSGRDIASLVWAPAGDKVYTTFKACYDANSEAGDADMSKGSQTDEAAAKAKQWMKEKGSKALESLEELYKEDKCASMCETPLFFWGTSIAEGPPKTDCLNAAVSAMSDGTGPAGAVALLSGLALIVAGIGGFPLCTGFNDKNDDE